METPSRRVSLRPPPPPGPSREDRGGAASVVQQTRVFRPPSDPRRPVPRDNLPTSPTGVAPGQQQGRKAGAKGAEATGRRSRPWRRRGRKRGSVLVTSNFLTIGVYFLSTSPPVGVTEGVVVHEREAKDKSVIDLQERHVKGVSPKSDVVVREDRGTVVLCGLVLVAEPHILVVLVANACQNGLSQYPHTASPHAPSSPFPPSFSSSCSSYRCRRHVHATVFPKGRTSRTK
mmetsp:Transcript_37496/g.73454  ORF Transcript_37496/g.73454 Transcript_37496/m.73454 type:complete len:231 (+) Transcript_37496:402-1094(+)